jgi:SAM-dependent methyltransferase
LEIGCGTGLLLTRLAADCETYIGTDFSEPVLQDLARYVATRPDLHHVELRHEPAHAISGVADGSIDLVILNSVVQYFPDVDYLLGVLRQAIRVTRSGGHIFIGDVRSLPLLEAYHASVQLHKADDGLSIADLRKRIQLAQDHDKELVISPTLFSALWEHWNGIGRVEYWVRVAAYDNELSRFRYDVVLTLGSRATMVSPVHWVKWDPVGRWRDDLRVFLHRTPRQSFGLLGVVDRRVAPALAAVEGLPDDELAGRSVGEIRVAYASATGENLNAIEALAGNMGVPVGWLFQPGGRGIYDVVFNPQWQEAASAVALDDEAQYTRNGLR